MKGNKESTGGLVAVAERIKALRGVKKGQVLRKLSSVFRLHDHKSIAIRIEHDLKNKSGRKT